MVLIARLNTRNLLRNHGIFFSVELFTGAEPVHQSLNRQCMFSACRTRQLLFKSAARVRFEQLPQPEQRSLIFWIDEAADNSERRARIGELIERLQRENAG